MQNVIKNAPKGRSLFGGRSDQNGSGDHWVTISGNHVLIHEGPAQQLPLPPSPRPPGVNQRAWDKNVEQTHISNTLGTVHTLGLIIFNETQPVSGSPNSNESLDDARQKAAHTVINADEMWGADRMKNASTSLPIEPSEKALSNPDVKSAYDASMKAAREAFLSGSDPTNGAVYFNLRTNAGRGNRIMSKDNKEGVRLSTQSGPYNNSYPNKDTPSRTVWIDTYYPPDK